MTRQWFTSGECTALEIRKYQSISMPHIVSAVTIEDSKVIQAIMTRIKGISVAGDVMKSFGPDAECVDLLFHGADGAIQKVAVYHERFKTPSTGFHSGPSETESALYADIDALLFPATGKLMLKTRDLELDFGEFSLTYLGETPSDTAPVSASWLVTQFLLKEKSGRSTMIRITSGQLAPRAYDVELDQEGFTLLTYETRTKQRLYPDYFQVIQRPH